MGQVTLFDGKKGSNWKDVTAIADAATTGATSTTPFGYTTAAQADSIITKLNLILAALRTHGFILP